jgi:carbon-monoxide dehydrogenase medium subunit
LLVDLKTGRVAAGHLISIGGIDEIRGVSLTDDGLRIGALTTITELDRSPVVRERFGALLDATCRMAAPAVRNVATVGGNICAAVPCADLPPILTAMNAGVLLWSKDGERRVALDSFFNGPRQTALRIGEVLVAAIVPTPPAAFGAAYARFGLRDGNTIAVAGVAASLRLDDKHTIREARIVLGAVAPIPKPVASACEALIGSKADGADFTEAASVAADAAEPICDVRGSAEFRREIVRVLARRALETSRDRAMEGASR